jgi:hypothetical protein
MFAAEIIGRRRLERALDAACGQPDTGRLPGEIE